MIQKCYAHQKNIEKEKTLSNKRQVKVNIPFFFKSVDQISPVKNSIGGRK